MSQERDKFEAWAKPEGYRCHWSPVSGNCEAGYDDMHSQHAWDAWLASRRAALEEAAQACEEEERLQDNDHGAANTGGAAACASAIRKLGEGA